MKRISIDPITRLEGHGKIDIFLNDDGGVDNATSRSRSSGDSRSSCEGMPVEEVPRVVSRICGV